MSGADIRDAFPGDEPTEELRSMTKERKAILARVLSIKNTIEVLEAQVAWVSTEIKKIKSRGKG